MQDRVVVVTGSSSGVGLAAAEQFARLGATVVVVGRNPDRLATAVDRVAAAGSRIPDSVRADFTRLDDVRALAGHLLERYPRIDVLANNAGAMSAAYVKTVDGYESTMQSNHLAPFLLTNLLADRLQGGRVINTASDAHRMGKVDPDDLVRSPKGYNSWREYGTSKAANILFTTESQQRWPGIHSTAFHPGVVRSNFAAENTAASLFYRYMPFLTTPEKAGALLVHLAAAATSPGGYYVGEKLKQPGPYARDPQLAVRLWEASTKAVGL